MNTGVWNGHTKAGELSASEALYGFAGWLTSQETPITAGATYDCSVWAEKVDQFCKANELLEPREGWHKKLKHPA